MVASWPKTRFGDIAVSVQYAQKRGQQRSSAKSAASRDGLRRSVHRLEINSLVLGGWHVMHPVLHTVVNQNLLPDSDVSRSPQATATYLASEGHSADDGISTCY